VAAALAEVRARPPLDPRGVPLELSAEQEAAVHAALGGRITAITGGPGSGKTWIVATLLRVVARLGEPPLPAVALAAPTGKAADRLRTSIAGSLASIAEPAAADRALMAALPPAVTLHRLLSYSPSGERFRHHERNPLPERLVVVDESSMLDLPLADHLVRSLPADGSLVLLGDAQQLPSVEAGAVFRDLVEAPAARPRTARLTRSWRMDPADPAGSAILALARRVAAGELRDLDRVVALRPSAEAVRFAGAELLAVTSRQLAPFLERWWREQVLGLPAYLRLASRPWQAQEGEIAGEEAASLAPLFGHLESFRLLSPTKGWSGGLGTAALNAWFRATLALASGGREAARDEPFPGEPVLMTRNDYARALYNGDQGVVLDVDVDGRRLTMAAFRRAEGGFRVIPLAALQGRLEPAWATTVHKAQGSEHDTVALVLPAEPSRLLTRELVYTALTRARHSLVLVGSPEVLRAAAARGVERWSGVGPKLATQPASPPKPGDQLGLPFD
jgi:exodeoxyribonuclease V alpha subunit